MTQIEIVGRRVVLRPFGPEQISERYLHWLNDPVVNSFSRRLGTTTDESQARSWLESLGEDECVLGIHVGVRGHVGNIKYGPIDWLNRRADLSIVVGEPAVRGQGVGAEAVYLVTRYLFEEKKLERVDAGSVNPAFLRLVAKLGWSIQRVSADEDRAQDDGVPYTVVAQSASAFTRQTQYEAS